MTKDLIRAKLRVTKMEFREEREEAIRAGKFGADFTEEAAVKLDADGCKGSHLHRPEGRALRA